MHVVTSCVFFFEHSCMPPLQHKKYSLSFTLQSKRFRPLYLLYLQQRPLNSILYISYSIFSPTILTKKQTYFTAHYNLYCRILYYHGRQGNEQSMMMQEKIAQAPYLADEIHTLKFRWDYTKSCWRLEMYRRPAARKHERKHASSARHLASHGLFWRGPCQPGPDRRAGLMHSIQLVGLARHDPVYGPGLVRARICKCAPATPLHYTSTRRHGC